MTGYIEQRANMGGAITVGAGGTSDYTELENKPSINNVTLDGNKTAEQLGLARSEDIPNIITPFIDTLNKIGSGVINTNQTFTYTATENCIIFINTYYQLDYGVTFYIDNVPIFTDYMNFSTSWQYVGHALHFYLKEGQTISFNIGNAPAAGEYNAFGLLRS